MKRPDYLGQFEQLILLALLRLRDKAYGMAIRREIMERTGRDVAIGAVYATLERLEAKGYVSCRDETGTADRGGRARRFFRIEADGATALKESFTAVSRMANGLKPVQEWS